MWSITLPETNSLHLKIGRAPKGNYYSNHPFSGAMLVSGRVNAALFGEEGGSGVRSSSSKTPSELCKLSWQPKRQPKNNAET